MTWFGKSAALAPGQALAVRYHPCLLSRPLHGGFPTALRTQATRVGHVFHHFAN
jgi:hypothetical protein